MTIDIKIASSNDIASNEIINLGCSDGWATGELSVASFLVEGTSNDLLVSVLAFVYGLSSKNIPGHDFWLLLGNSAWQSDTRMVRYRKLWGALKFRGHEVLGGADLQESLIELGGKIKFFGALRLSELSFNTAIGALLSERCSYFALLPSGYEVRSVLCKGWSGQLTEDLNFIDCICDENGLVFKSIGEFDDVERGFVSIGSTELITQLLK
ncbi:hypothetical protein [Pseudomonas sp. Marseille-P9899]|uniref:hypothetical protein n=1 Tax=Pseudomonas sp. Marseille-P9899 TaxID=2730401 RepID=UPI001589CB80|nr:hypothetical protein [Pseudomonas sp. Marseille-P9899]